MTRPLTTRFVPFSPPNIGEAEIQEAIDTLRSSWITTGPKTKRFETEFADYVNAPAALGLTSCTAGLHLSLLALGIGRGDKVATTPMTFAASVNVIEHVGATPVLVDVEPDTLNLSPERLAEALDPDVKAVIAVHYAGHPVDMDALTEITSSRSIALIEDAAHALAASYKGGAIGSHGNLTSYSFYATKNITTCEGGMLTGDPELIARAKMLSLHGLSQDAAKRYERGASWKYDVIAPGFKYNMTDLAAGLGLIQLRRLAEFQERRRWIVDTYNRSFADLAELETPPERPDVISALHLYGIRLNLETLGIGRDEVIERLNDRGIGTSVHFIPIHNHPYYREKYGYQPQDFPVTQGAFERLISLPLNSVMDDDDVAYVIECVRDVLIDARR